MNYLQLCQGLAYELGLSGITGLTSTQNNTIIEFVNVTRWIHDAALQIDNLWQDWKYLWNQWDDPSEIVGTQVFTLPVGGVVQWDINKMRYRQQGLVGGWQNLDYVERQVFLDLFDPDNAVPGSPNAFTVLPDNTIMLGAPTDAVYDFKGEYWARPIELLQDTDAPGMPAQYHRIILCRAGVMYGNREDAPEVIQGLEAEYIDMLDKLQSDQLEGFALRRTSTDRERMAPTRRRLSEFIL